MIDSKGLRIARRSEGRKLLSPLESKGYDSCNQESRRSLNVPQLISRVFIRAWKVSALASANGDPRDRNRIKVARTNSLVFIWKWGFILPPKSQNQKAYNCNARKPNRIVVFSLCVFHGSISSVTSQFVSLASLFSGLIVRGLQIGIPLKITLATLGIVISASVIRVAFLAELAACSIVAHVTHSIHFRITSRGHLKVSLGTFFRDFYGILSRNLFSGFLWNDASSSCLSSRFII